LVVVAVVLDPFLAPHRSTVRPILAPGRQHTFTLDDQHIPKVASVFKGRPHVGLWPCADRNGAVAQDLGNVGDPRPDGITGFQGVAKVVGEIALSAEARHRVIISETAPAADATQSPARHTTGSAGAVGVEVRDRTGALERIDH
jgi:hypothetical protein